MNLTQFLLILRARWWVAAIALIITVATTYGVSMMLPKSYTASVSLVVDAKSRDPLTGMIIPSQLLSGYMATQVDIIQSQNVALRVVDALKLTDHPTVRADFMAATQGRGDLRNWMADLLRKRLEVTPSRESNVIQISFTGTDPRFAAAIANAFATAYVQANLDLRVEPARQLNDWYGGQIEQLRAKLESAQAALTAYQREQGMVWDERSMDVEAARMAELSSQLVAAQAQTFDSTSRKQQSLNALAEVEQNPVVQGLKRDLAVADANLSQLGEKVGRNHPQYLAAQAQVEALSARLEQEMKLATRTVGTTARVAQQREGELRAALNAQKARVIALRNQRDQAAVLLREVNNAQALYDAALQRAGQSRLESLATQTDVAVLNPAVAPIEPSGPRVILNTVLAGFLGTLLGIGLAFLLELIDRRVRSAEDLSAGLELPVLGELNWQPRRGVLRRFARAQA